MVVIEEKEFIEDIKMVLKMFSEQEIEDRLRALGREPEDIEAFFNTLEEE